jgi:hypothetical protein
MWDNRQGYMVTRKLPILTKVFSLPPPIHNITDIAQIAHIHTRFTWDYIGFCIYG